MAGKRGRPPYNPSAKDRRTVKALTLAAIKEDEIAKIMGVSVKTLRKYHGPEMKTYRNQRNADVVSQLYVNATKHNNVAAQIFICKTQLGFREVQVIDETSEKRIVYLDKPLSKEEWAEHYGQKEVL